MSELARDNFDAVTLFESDRSMRCKRCSSTLTIESLSMVNGWQRRRAMCTGIDCDYFQIVGYHDGTHEYATFPDIRFTPPVTGRMLDAQTEPTLQLVLQATPKAPAAHPPAQTPGDSTDQDEPSEQERTSGESRNDSTKCLVATCERPSHARGMCGACYKRWHSTGKPDLEEFATLPFTSRRSPSMAKQSPPPQSQQRTVATSSGYVTHRTPPKPAPAPTEAAIDDTIESAITAIDQLIIRSEHELNALRTARTILAQKATA